MVTYPFEPLCWLSRKVGEFYWENFGDILDNIAINNEYLESFAYCDSIYGKDKYDLYVNFINGIGQRIASPKKKYFINKLIPELEEKFGVEIKESESGITIE